MFCFIMRMGTLVTSGTSTSQHPTFASDHNWPRYGRTYCSTLHSCYLHETQQIRQTLQAFICGPYTLAFKKIHDPWVREYNLTDDAIGDMLAVIQREEKLEPPFEVCRSHYSVLIWLGRIPSVLGSKSSSKRLCGVQATYNTRQ